MPSRSWGKSAGQAAGARRAQPLRSRRWIVDGSMPRISAAFFLPPHLSITHMMCSSSSRRSGTSFIFANSTGDGGANSSGSSRAASSKFARKPPGTRPE